MRIVGHDLFCESKLMPKQNRCLCFPGFYALLASFIVALTEFSAPVWADANVGMTDSGLSNYSKYTVANFGNPFASRASGMGSCVPPSRESFLPGGENNTPPLSAYLLPELGLSELYTDNIYLAPAGNERSDSATILSPGFRGCTVGSIFRAKFNYTGEGIWYARNPPPNSFFNQINGDFHAQILPGHLFLGGNTSYGQTAIDPYQAYSSNNAYVVPGNRTNIWTSNLSPYWLQSLGPLGLATLRYSYGRVEYGNSSLYNSTSRGESFVLNSPGYNTHWSWTVNWSTNTVRYDRLGTNVYFDNAYLTLGYQLTQHLRLLGTDGVEDNYLPNGDIQRYGSAYWNAGFAWQDLRFSLEALWGHRFFGTSFNVNAQYHVPNMTAGLQYTETPIVEATQAPTFIANSPASAPIYTNPVPLNQSLYTSAYLDKRLQGYFTYEFSMSSFSFSLYDEHNDYFVKQFGRYRLRGGSVAWNWTLSERSRLMANFQREGIVQDNLAPFFTNSESIGWTYLITPVTHLAFTVSRESAQSVYAYQRYAADSVILQLNTIF